MRRVQIRDEVLPVDVMYDLLETELYVLTMLHQLLCSIDQEL